MRRNNTFAVYYFTNYHVDAHDEAEHGKARMGVCEMRRPTFSRTLAVACSALSPRDRIIFNKRMEREHRH